MRYVAMILLSGGLALGGQALALAADEHGHAHGAVGEQTLTGEVVDVVCYLSHPENALGAGHADCAKKCITSGLPVAIKVGEQLYLALGPEHNTANALLAAHAGKQVTVHGTVLERDGQHAIVVKRVE